MRSDRFFLAAGTLFGLAFVFVTPPFQVPDEPSHFYRAYAVSEGVLWAERSEEELGASLPASLEEIGTGLRGDLPHPPGWTVSREEIVRALQVPLDAERRAFIDYRTSAQLTFVPYLSQAAGIVIARGLGAPVLGLLYAARITNLLVTTALIGLGLRRLPSFHWLIAMLALTPMALFLRASASADAPTMAMAFLLACAVARLAWGEEARAGWKEVAVLTTCAAALCLTKPAYVALVFLVLLIPASRLPGGRRGPALALFAAITLSAFLCAMATAGGVDVPIRPDAPVDRDRQIRDALADPVRVARIVAEDYRQRGDRYAAQIVGQLGWLDTNLPRWLLWGYATLLGLLTLFDSRRNVEVRLWQRGLLGLIAVATLALVSASQYAFWTPYGADHVDGIQGRYFIPLAPAAAWILHTRRFAVHPDLLNRVLPWLSLLSFGSTLWLLLRRYYEV